MNKKITIVTGTGSSLGTGHFQRMANLAISINRTKNMSASIFLPYNLPYKEHSLIEKFKDILIEDIPLDYGRMQCVHTFKDILVENIPLDTDLIIRDMRDSSVDEIKSLKAIAPVLTIDDIGEGRNIADYKLYLLPALLDNTKLNHKLFLYGYNFMYGITLLKEKKSIKKDIDIAIYLGYDPDKKLIANIKKSIPENLSSILLSNNRAASLTGRVIADNLQYGEILCRSKIVITHFGITMFEAHICGCKIIALNPSAYHSALTDIIYDDFNILYKSDYKSFIPDEMFNIIDKNLKIINDKVIAVDNILKKINSGNENFIKYIKRILFI